MKNLIHAAQAAAVAAVLTSSAFAGAPMHRLPAPQPADQAKSTYDLKVDAMPQVGKPLLVALIDRASGKRVTNGQVVMLRAVYRGDKAVPAIQMVPEALPQAADGRYVCAAEHHADGVTLRGAGPDGESPVRISLGVHS